MDYFPIFLRLKGERAVVVGGGEVAARKVDLLLKAEARVVVVAPDAGELRHQLRRVAVRKPRLQRCRGRIPQPEDQALRLDHLHDVAENWKKLPRMVRLLDACAEVRKRRNLRHRSLS